jgi:hypothetical protein
VAPLSGCGRRLSAAVYAETGTIAVRESIRAIANESFVIVLSFFSECPRKMRTFQRIVYLWPET